MAKRKQADVQESKPEEENPLSGIEALIDTQTIEGYEVKEWSITQFTKLYPHIKTVVNNLVSQGINLDNVEDTIKNDWLTLVDAIVPVLPVILEVSLKIDSDEVDKIDYVKGAQLGVVIIQKNVEHVVGFFVQARRSVENVQGQSQKTN